MRDNRCSSETMTSRSRCVWPSASAASSSAWPRATVIGVRRRWEASRMKSRSRSAAARTSASDAARRRACQTIATNIALMSGTSVISSMPWPVCRELFSSAAPVVRPTTKRTRLVARGDQTRKPYRIVRLTQTKWNGTVCHSSSQSMMPTFAAANAPHASSGQRRAMRERVSGMADCFDHRAAELGAQAADVDVDDIGARVEAAAPDLLEQLGARAHLALVEREMLEQQELARGQRNRPVARVGGAAVRVEGQAAGAQQPVGRLGAALAQARPHAGHELGERERLGEVVGGAELEAADLGVDVRQRREDQDALLGAGLDRAAQDPHAVDTGHEEVEHDEVVLPRARELEAFGARRRGVDGQPVGGESTRDEVGDLRLVVDDEDLRHG